MSLLRYFTRDHAVRVVKAIREEGFFPAMGRVWFHMRLALTGRGHSAMTSAHKKGAPQLGPHYLARFWQDMAEAGAFQATQSPAVLRRRRKLALIGDINLPQCRKYRAEQLAGLCAGLDIAYDFAHEGDVPRATALLQDASHLMFYRTRAVPQMSMYLYEARRLKLPVAYDIDDPLFSIPAYATYGNMEAIAPGLKAHFLSEAPRYLDAMQLADIVTLSTPGLAAHAASLVPRPTHVRRNYADPDTWAAAEQVTRKGPDAAFTLVFASGSQGHEADFAEVASDVEAFVAGGAERRLRILGHFDLDALPLALRARTTAHPFTDYASYLTELAQADCALMPLADDLFNRCKSGVRVIDAAAVAVPSIVGPVGDLPNLVQDGATGRVVAAGASWREAMEQLAQTGASREMGAAAQRALQEHWSDPTGADITAPELKAWLIE